MRGEGKNLYHFAAPPDTRGMTLYEFLRGPLGLSRMMVSRLRREGGIYLNGEEVFTRTMVLPGDRVTIRLPPEDIGQVVPQPLPLEIIHEDGEILVVNKPPGQVVHPTRDYKAGTVANAVAYHWSVRGEPRRIRPVHRLDKNTSGLLVFAKNALVHHYLDRQRGKQGECMFSRYYLAAVRGHPPRSEGKIQGGIARHPEKQAFRIVSREGKPATTYYRTLRQWPDASLLLIKISTGRTHQIRVHLKHLGCPILGDTMYGEASPLIGRQALHAWRLTLRLPRLGLGRTFTAPLTTDLKELLRELSLGKG